VAGSLGSRSAPLASHVRSGRAYLRQFEGDVKGRHGRVRVAASASNNEPDAGEVFVLYLDPTRRGEGMSTLIFDAITEQQRAQGAREQWVGIELRIRRAFPSTTLAASSCRVVSGPSQPSEVRICGTRLRWQSPTS
jgi:GNAT superfamily N-acetyltransferase